MRATRRGQEGRRFRHQEGERLWREREVRHDTHSNKPSPQNLETLMPCIQHPAPYTLHPTLYTLHPTPCTLPPYYLKTLQPKALKRRVHQTPELLNPVTPTS
jgi:hypothetical protein